MLSRLFKITGREMCLRNILWTIFRFYEKGETRYMDFMKDKIKIVNDIFAKDLEDKKNETCGG